ncbi:MAG: hypothetical protein IT233_13530 [Bacteroidia bacterium]|nr:hypothetical protein [Bacteroidia bacterium]
MRKLLHISLFFLLPVWAGAQVDSLNKAIDLYSAKDFAAAIRVINGVVEHPATMNMPNSWYLRGLIYKEYFKNFEAADSRSKARDESVRSFFKVIELDTARKFVDASVYQSLKFLGSTYYNTSTDFFTKDSYKIAIEYFEIYKKCYQIADPTFDSRPSHIKFYLALGTAMEEIFVSNRKVNFEYMDVTSGMFRKVLEMDSVNVTAYYNLCVLYYNQGVSVINDMSDETDILDMDQVQDKALVFFKQALPYALKAYELDPKRRETLVSLSGIYFSLHENDKEAQIKAELELLDKK